MIDLPKISIFTLGCKVNQYDTDAMLAVFKSAGFEITEGLEFADVYIINSCAVTAEAEKKSRQAVTRIKKVNPSATIYVCGCASQNNFAQFAKDGVKYIAGTGGKLGLARRIVEEYTGEDEVFDKIFNPDDFTIGSTFEENDGVVNLLTRHFIKVQDGCNNFCSYCLIPYVRGRSRSRAEESILRELDEVEGVVKEVVVTGINLSAYGRDTATSLTELLKKFAKYKKFGVRLGSLEVGVIDREFLDATKKIKLFCPHFHLSLQSGDDNVLKAMNRHYTTKEYYAAVRLIREYYPNAAITTDIIVGYPAETEEEFKNSMKFARKVGFADIHVFPYSSRKGTVAGRMKPLAPEILDDRAKRMGEVKQELIGNYLMKQIGLPVRVLFETQEDGVWVGHTQTYVKVYSKKGARNKVFTITPQRRYKDGICDASVPNRTD
ncbi:MAG: tRNA (N(6)-L-threonylcarbamoyladenosine(37)-C(2))-methylthiotransferase MtaB [Clostridia bacterium]|nr:tRNA (N(6)-L-threonylcarbamoyladenosine(37)-C(2))-methylthiotransferase MtaB [Clostridia bacterium]